MRDPYEACRTWHYYYSRLFARGGRPPVVSVPTLNGYGDNDARIVYLTGKHSQGHFALVSAADYPRVIQRCWSYNQDGYAMGYYLKGEERATHSSLIALHRFIVQPAPGLVVDHINSNKLDNRRCNLQAVTPADNARKRRKKMLSRDEERSMLLAILRGELA